MSASTPAPRRQLSLLWKILAAMLVAAAVPLGLISALALSGYTTASDQAAGSAAALLDTAAQTALQQRTVQTADEISRFLEDRVQDAQTLALLPPTVEAYRQFSRAHQRGLWFSDASQQGQRVVTPLYRELAFIDADGQEQLRIRDGQAVPASELRNVADPANTSYRSETYVAEARKLTPGRVWVSRVTTWHSVGQDRAGAGHGQQTDAQRYRSYEAVIRFATPVLDAQGAPAGVVMLALDHRHLMEFALHIQTTGTQQQRPWPDYQSGNYAFLFDDEGYTVAHPVLARIRGLDAQGQPLPAATSREELASRPFNVGQAGWQDPKLPGLYQAVLKQQAGMIATVNQAGAVKVSTYAPIRFSAGVYAERGVFGGLVLGANSAEFHSAATTIQAIVAEQRGRFQTGLLSSVLLVVVILLGVTWLITRGITQPIRSLTEAALRMEHGELDAATLDTLHGRALEDEVSRLARVFKQMAQKVQLRERSLKQEIGRLHIEIDMRKQERQVAEITESDFFRNLQGRAQHLRARARGLADQLDADDAPLLGATGSAD